jgi:hypothetical protein
LGAANQIDWQRAALDAARVSAPRGQQTGPNPTMEAGSKRHLIVDGRGIPLVIRHTAANTHETTMLETMVDAIPAIWRSHGHASPSEQAACG